MSIGIRYQPIESLNLVLDLEKDVELDPQLRMGVEYQLTSFFILRTGWSLVPLIFSGGFGFIYNRWIMGYSTHRHPVLNFSHQFSLSFDLKKP
jgi:hypothetical protein